MNRDSEPRYPGLPPAATPDEIAARESRYEAEQRRQMSVADAMRIRDAAPDLLAACEAAIAYDNAIAGRAARGEVDLREGIGTAEGADLDALYLDWITKSRAAIAKARGKA